MQRRGRIALSEPSASDLTQSVQFSDFDLGHLAGQRERA